MGKTVRKKGLIFLLAFAVTLSFLPALSSVTRADDTDGPLDFVADPSSRTGDGWSWDKDHALLTLSGASVDLIDYAGEYEAAIRLPKVDGGVTIVLDGGAMVNVSGTGHLAVSCLGDLTIKGDEFYVQAQDGANGIEAAGNLTIGEGAQPKTGLLCKILAMDYAAASEEVLHVTGTRLNVDIEGTNEDPDAEKCALIGENTSQAENGVVIEDSIIQSFTDGSGSAGVISYCGALKVANTAYEQYTGDEAEGISGIVNANGDIFIQDSNLELDLGGESDTNGVMISAEMLPSVPADKPSIQLSGTTLTGTVEGEGLSAFYGGVEILDKSEVDVTAVGHAVKSGSLGLTVKESTVTLINTGDYFSDAVNSVGPVTFDSANAYLSGRGEKASGLCTTGGHVIVKGEKTTVDMNGDCAAFEVNTNLSEDAPLELNDGIEPLVGGTLQHVDYMDLGAQERVFSFSEGVLSVIDNELKNASQHVVFGNPDGLVVISQPKDAYVSYPDRAEFEVAVQNPENVASYQWSLVDTAGKEWILDGSSAVTNKLILPSTIQYVGDVCKYRCKITDRNGNETYSAFASLVIQNKEESKMVFYAGENAIEPGETLDLASVGCGSGTISFAGNGRSVTLNQVNFNNKNVVYDHTDSPAIGLMLYGRDRTEKEFRVHLIGKNKIVNRFNQADRDMSGLAFDFDLSGVEDEAGEVSFPKVIFDGNKIDGYNLVTKGGTFGIHSSGSIEIRTNIRTKVMKEQTSGGIYVENGGLLLSEGANVRLETNGQAIAVGSNNPSLFEEMNLEVRDGATLSCSCDVPAPLTSSGLSLTAVSVANRIEVSDGANVRVDLLPTMARLASKGAPIEAMAGLSAQGGIEIENAAADVNLFPIGEGDLYFFAGIASEGVAITDSTVNVTTSGIACGQGAGINGELFLNVTENSNVNVDIGAEANVFGMETTNQMVVANSNVDVQTDSTYGDQQIALACGTFEADLSDGIHKVAADTNGGYALCALIGDSASPVSYQPGYKPVQIMMAENTGILLPKDCDISTFGMPSQGGPTYLKTETVFDMKDTSKPAASVTIGQATDLSAAVVSLAKTAAVYNGKEWKPAVKSVELDGMTLDAGKDYVVSYVDNVNAGKACVIVTGKGRYSGSAAAYFTIAKAKQTIKVKTKKQTLKVKTLKKKKKVTVKAIQVKGNKGKPVYQKAGVNKKKFNKCFLVNKKTGAITVTKNVKPGTYKVYVKVAAKGTGNYKASAVKTVAVKIVVK